MSPNIYLMGPVAQHVQKCRKTRLGALKEFHFLFEKFGTIMAVSFTPELGVFWHDQCDFFVLFFYKRSQQSLRWRAIGLSRLKIDYHLPLVPYMPQTFTLNPSFPEKIKFLSEWTRWKIQTHFKSFVFVNNDFRFGRKETNNLFQEKIWKCTMFRFLPSYSEG